jgi:hypothetical protein
LTATATATATMNVDGDVDLGELQLRHEAAQQCE